jgi:hypothetical protein
MNIQLEGSTTTWRPWRPYHWYDASFARENFDNVSRHEMQERVFPKITGRVTMPILTERRDT